MYHNKHTFSSCREKLWGSESLTSLGFKTCSAFALALALCMPQAKWCSVELVEEESHHAACRILVPQPGIKPMILAAEARTLSRWTTREFPGRWAIKAPSAVPPRAAKLLRASALHWGTTLPGLQVKSSQGGSSCFRSPTAVGMHIVEANPVLKLTWITFCLGFNTVIQFFECWNLRLLLGGGP